MIIIYVHYICVELETSLKSSIIQLEKIEIKDIAIDNDFSKLEYCTISSCKYQYLNGKFKQTRNRCGSPLYQNVRGWCIFRADLMEIPEIGIMAKTCYDDNAELNSSDKLGKIAGNYIT